MQLLISIIFPNTNTVPLGIQVIVSRHAHRVCGPLLPFNAPRQADSHSPGLGLMCNEYPVSMCACSVATISISANLSSEILLLYLVKPYYSTLIPSNHVLYVLYVLYELKLNSVVWYCLCHEGCFEVCEFLLEHIDPVAQLQDDGK